MDNENDLLGTLPTPEGETVEIPGNEPPAPEQNDDELDTNAGQGGEGSDEQEAAKPEETEKPKPKPTFYEKRFGELTFEKREAQRIAEEHRREAAELRAENERLRAGETVEPRQEPAQRQPAGEAAPDVETAAANLVASREFAAKISSVISAGEAEYDKEAFTHKSNLIASLAGDKTTEFMKIVTDTDIVADGHKVIAALADNPEEAERVLRLSPVKMALELAKLSATVSKPKTKPISQVPAPVQPVNGAARTSTRIDDPDMPMDQFGPAFLKSLANKGRR